jgi:hypothetical protein
MSSISNSFGKKHDYSELLDLHSDELKKFKNIVLIVIDGMGYNFLQKQQNSFLKENLKFKMTSTFLSTTTCANTAFYVGYPPQQHGLTAWDINLKEVGAITTVLPFIPMYGGQNLIDSGFKMDQIMNIKSFHKGFNGDCFVLMDKTLCKSAFTDYVSTNAKIIPTSNYKNVFTKLGVLINKQSPKRRFIHAYLGELDGLTHEEGPNGKKVTKFFRDLDKRIKNLSKTIKGTNTKLIIVADHGLIEVSPKKTIWVEKINGLKDCLTISPAGEPRVGDFFVRPSKVEQFERIMKTQMKDYCWCFKGEKLIRDNFYGLGKPSPKLKDRVGDYVLIMKENYTLRNKLANHKKPKKPTLGSHGGVSDDEMFVPLITIDC